MDTVSFPAKYRTEIDLLQGAFQTFKTQSNAENHKRLKEQKAQLADKYAKDIQSKINEISKPWHVGSSSLFRKVESNFICVFSSNEVEK